MNVTMWHDGDEDMCRITLGRHGDRHAAETITLYEGAVTAWRDLGPLGRMALRAANQVPETTTVG